MPGYQRLSPSLTPSKTYTNPDRSTTTGKNHTRRALHLGSSDGLIHPEINNKDFVAKIIPKLSAYSRTN